MRFAFAVLGTTALLALPTAVDTAGAQSAQSASISKDGLCSAVTAGLSITTFDSTAVKSGPNVSYTCHFSLPANLVPASATHSDGFVCWTPFGGTTDSRLVVTPGARATMTCKINRNNPEYIDDGGDGGPIPL